MCWEWIAHHMACEGGRPLMTDTADEDSNLVIVNPYAQPIPCDEKDCPGSIHPDHPAAPPRVDKEADLVPCKWHLCCRIEIFQLFCPCCPGIDDAADCKHFVVYHAYHHTLKYTAGGGLSSASRSGRAIRNFGGDGGWAAADVPDRDTLAGGAAPRETLLFGQARRNLFKLGARLLVGRRVAAEARLAYDRSGGGPEEVAANRSRWNEARAAAASLRASLVDALDLYFRLEQEGQGIVYARFVEKARKLMGAPPKPATEEEKKSMREFAEGMRRMRPQA